MTLLNIGSAALVLGLALCAPPVAAQQTPEDRIQVAMARATAQGLPASVLQSKLDEGRAKNVPVARIAQAIETRARALETARTALQQAQHDAPSTADLAVGADAIEAGVSKAVLTRVAAMAGSERRTVAIAALAYLVTQGHLPQAALERIEQALSTGGHGLGDLRSMARPEHPHGGPPRGVPPAGKPGGVGKPEGTPGKGPPGGVPPGKS